MKPRIHNSEYSFRRNGTMIIKCTFPVPSTRHLDRVLRSNSFEILNELFRNSNTPAKEISESYAAFQHVKSSIGMSRMNETLFLHIGDGAWLRTAAIFSLFSRSINVSIDPVINDNALSWVDKYNVKRLYGYKCKFEDFDDKEIDYPYQYLGIILVHSHVESEVILQRWSNWDWFYTNPCCINKVLPSDEFTEKNKLVLMRQKEDWGILSEKREIWVFRNGVKK